MVRRDLAIADISRMWGRIQALKALHRSRDWDRALDIYPEIRRGLTGIQNRLPDLSEIDTEQILGGISQLMDMENEVDKSTGDRSQINVSQFNAQLSLIELLLTDLESRLQQSA
ncbi:MAG: hypothetical protein ACE5Q6_21865 [Dehalococcoidia bacterium]